MGWYPLGDENMFSSLAEILINTILFPLYVFYSLHSVLYTLSGLCKHKLDPKLLSIEYSINAKISSSCPSNHLFKLTMQYVLFTIAYRLETLWTIVSINWVSMRLHPCRDQSHWALLVPTSLRSLSAAHILSTLAAFPRLCLQLYSMWLLHCRFY